MPVQIGGDNRARGTLTAQPMQAFVPAPPQIQASPVGRAMQGLGQGLTDLASAVHQDQASRDALQSAKLVEQFKTKAFTGIQALDPLGTDYENEVRRVSREAGEDTVGQADFYSNDARDALQANVSTQTEGFVRTALAERHTQLTQQAGEQWQQFANTALAQIRKDPAGADLYLQQLNENVKGLGDALPQKARETLSLKFAQQSIFAAVDGFVAAGEYDAAAAYADAHQGALDNENFRALKGIVKAGRVEGDQNRAASGARWQADRRIEIASALTLDDLAKVQSNIEEYDRAGGFTGQENDRAALLVGIASQRSQIITASNKLSEALGEVGTGFTSPENGDRAFKFLSAPYEADPAKYASFLDDWVKNTGHIPSSVRAAVKRAEVANDPILLAAAAEQVKRLQGTGVGPTADFGTNEKDSRVLQVIAMHDALGEPYDAAAVFVTQQVNDPATTKYRLEQFQKDRTGADNIFGTAQAPFDPKEFLLSNSAAGGARIPGTKLYLPGLGPARIDPEVSQAFEDILKGFYLQSGNAEVAKAAALQRFSQTYGVSNVSGEKVLTKYPPEAQFPPQVAGELTPDVATSIVRGEISRGLVTLGVVPANVVGAAEDQSGIPAFTLVADNLTKTGTGAPVSYSVRVRGAEGAHVPIPLPDGTFLRYTMPTYDQLAATPEYAAAVARGSAPTVLGIPIQPGAKPGLTTITKPKFGTPSLGAKGPWTTRGFDTRTTDLKPQPLPKTGMDLTNQLLGIAPKGE